MNINEFFESITEMVLSPTHNLRDILRMLSISIIINCFMVFDRLNLPKEYNYVHGANANKVKLSRVP